MASRGWGNNIYRVNVLQEITHGELRSQSTMITIVANLTIIILYDTQYNVSIISSLCGVTTTKVLNYGKYYYIFDSEEWCMFWSIICMTVMQ